MTKTEKMALLMAYHQVVEPVEEDELMKRMSYVINGIDEKFMDWTPYIDFVIQEGENNG